MCSAQIFALVFSLRTQTQKGEAQTNKYSALVALTRDIFSLPIPSLIFFFSLNMSSKQHKGRSKNVGKQKEGNENIKHLTIDCCNYG